MKNRLRAALLLAALLTIAVVPVVVLAQAETPPPETTPVLDLATRVIIIAGMVSAIVQGIKKLIPGLGGPVVMILNVVASVAATYAVAEPGSVFSLSFLLQAFMAALGAAGVHSFFRPGTAK